jgi:hypothetical protein
VLNRAKAIVTWLLSEERQNAGCLPHAASDRGKRGRRARHAHEQSAAIHPRVAVPACALPDSSPYWIEQAGLYTSTLEHYSLNDMEIGSFAGLYFNPFLLNSKEYWVAGPR